jgi:hypothetical protein
MSAVDLAKQLMVIGRQLQAMEQRLTHPSNAPTLPLALQQLLTDPLARLSGLIQPLANWPVPQPTSDDSARGLAPSQRSPHASELRVGSRVERPQPAANTPTGWGEPYSSSARGEATQPFSSTPEPMPVWSGRTGEARKTPPVTPGQGARLTREASALLSILQLNMAHPAEPPTGTAPGGMLATGPGAGAVADSGHAARARSAAARGLLPPVPNLAEPQVSPTVKNTSMVTHGQDDGTTTTPLLEIAPSHERTPATRNLSDRLYLPQAALGAELSPQSVFPLPPEEGERGSVWASSEIPLTPALPQREREATGVAGPAAPLIMGPMPPVDAIFPPQLADPSHGLLHAAQLEQVMEALADRLELMLLRAYGTTGA